MKFSNFYIKLLINYDACASAMRVTIKINKEKSAKTALVLTIGIALVFTAIATSLPYYNPEASAQQTNQTNAGGIQNNTTNNNNIGIGNVKTIPKVANLPPGNNTKIITQNRNIANPSTFKAFSKEHGTNASTPSSISQLPKNTTSNGNK
jgi:23S rRNA A1618 N6-methylase RlmF